MSASCKRANKTQADQLNQTTLSHSKKTTTTTPSSSSAAAGGGAAGAGGKSSFLTRIVNLFRKKKTSRTTTTTSTSTAAAAATTVLSSSTKSTCHKKSSSKKPKWTKSMGNLTTMENNPLVDYSHYHHPLDSHSHFQHRSCWNLSNFHPILHNNACFVSQRLLNEVSSVSSSSCEEDYFNNSSCQSFTFNKHNQTDEEEEEEEENNHEVYDEPYAFIYPDQHQRHQGIYYPTFSPHSHPHPPPLPRPTAAADVFYSHANSEDHFTSISQQQQQQQQHQQHHRLHQRFRVYNHNNTPVSSDAANSRSMPLSVLNVEEDFGQFTTVKKTSRENLLSLNYGVPRDQVTSNMRSTWFRALYLSKLSNNNNNNNTPPSPPPPPPPPHHPLNDPHDLQDLHYDPRDDSWLLVL